jgi:hypothetical protein
MARKPRAAQLGVTPDEYARLLAGQHGHCALCPNTPKTRRLSVDHDHRTGAVRGLLCYRCNRALPAYLPAEWFARAAEYVSRDAGENYGQSARSDSTSPVIIDARAAEIAELRATGMTLQAIADRYGISRQRVHQIIRRVVTESLLPGPGSKPPRFVIDTGASLHLPQTESLRGRAVASSIHGYRGYVRTYEQALASERVACPRCFPEGLS